MTGCSRSRPPVIMHDRTLVAGSAATGSGPAKENGLPPFDRSAEPILRYLVGNGFIDQDGEMLFIGPAAEAKFGRRHFMGMTAAFTAPPQFTVISGRDEIGRTDPMLLTEHVDGPRLILPGRPKLESAVAEAQDGQVIQFLAGGARATSPVPPATRRPPPGPAAGRLPGRAAAAARR